MISHPECSCNSGLFIHSSNNIYFVSIMNQHRVLGQSNAESSECVQFSLVAELCPTLFLPPWTAACQMFLSIASSWSLMKLMSIESVMPSNHLILCCPFLLLPSIFPASGSFLMSGLFALGGQSIKSFSFSISPSNEYSELISFWIHWFDLFAV